MKKVTWVLMFTILLTLSSPGFTKVDNGTVSVQSSGQGNTNP